jgi:ribosomal protein S18 acetylase RimI-like enzyme
MSNHDLKTALAEFEMNGYSLRMAVPEDHKAIVDVMVDWWGGRDLRYMLSKLFFNHFHKTSFIVEKQGDLAGFLVGFMSPSLENEAYIHFSGIHPDHRKNGLGRILYQAFFGACNDNSRSIVKCCTSPVNIDSIGFHTRIGFEVVPGNGEENGFAITKGYNREGDSKVIFRINLEDL